MSERRRALIAATVAVLGALLGVPGVGHAYLRQWRRAVAWFAVVIGAILALVFAFVDPATLAALGSGNPFAVTVDDLPTVVVGPYYFLLSLSIADAYLVGRRLDARERAAAAASCPSCGREWDPELGFCWYCSQSYESVE